MKVIFLDVDGVLNHKGCKELIGGMYGVEDDLLDRLAEIVRRTGAEIILVSSWKTFWDKQSPSSKELDPMAKYLFDRLKSRGLHIADRTVEKNPAQRGLGIIGWLRLVKDVEAWVVLDDEIFPDYEERGVLPHLVKTSFGIGLTDKSVEKAIEILMKEK